MLHLLLPMSPAPQSEKTHDKLVSEFDDSNITVCVFFSSLSFGS